MASKTSKAKLDAHGVSRGPFDKKEINRSDKTSICGSGDHAAELRWLSDYKVGKEDKIKEYLKHDQIAFNMITYAVEDGLSSWRDISNSDLSGIDDRLNTAIAFRDAWEESRTYGQSYLLPIIVDGENQQVDTNISADELGEDKKEVVRLVHIKSLKVDGDDRITDPTSLWYDQPERYEFKNAKGKTQKIHGSRLIHIGDGRSFFIGILTSLANYHESRHRKMQSQRRNAALAWLTDLDQLVRTMTVQSGGKKSAKEILTEAAIMIDENINDYSVALLSKGSELLNINQTNINQLVKSIEQEQLILSAEGGYTYSRLWGKPTGGLASTSSDIKNYIQSTSSKRSRDIEPGLNQYDQIMSIVYNKEFKRSDWKWKPMPMAESIEQEPNVTD